MNELEVMFFNAMYLLSIISIVPLAVSMICGLFVSILQAATQIQEQTLTFVPKLIFVGLLLLYGGKYFGNLVVEYSKELFISVAHF